MKKKYQRVKFIPKKRRCKYHDCVKDVERPNALFCCKEHKNAYHNEEALKKSTEMSGIVVALAQDKIEADNKYLEVIKVNNDQQRVITDQQTEISDLKKAYTEVATRYNEVADILNKMQIQQSSNASAPQESLQEKQLENKEPEKIFFGWW